MKLGKGNVSVNLNFFLQIKLSKNRAVYLDLVWEWFEVSQALQVYEIRAQQGWDFLNYYLLLLLFYLFFPPHFFVKKLIGKYFCLLVPLFALLLLRSHSSFHNLLVQNEMDPAGMPCTPLFYLLKRVLL